MTRPRFTIAGLLTLTLLVSLAVVVVRQRSEIAVLKSNNAAMSAAYAKQKRKLSQYMTWYWQKAFDNRED